MQVQCPQGGVINLKMMRVICTSNPDDGMRAASTITLMIRSYGFRTNKVLSTINGTTPPPPLLTLREVAHLTGGGEVGEAKATTILETMGNIIMPPSAHAIIIR